MKADEYQKKNSLMMQIGYKEKLYIILTKKVFLIKRSIQILNGVLLLAINTRMTWKAIEFWTKLFKMDCSASRINAIR